jgi:hypothetical protein
MGQHWRAVVAKYHLVIKNPQSPPSRKRQPGLGKSRLTDCRVKAVGWLWQDFFMHECEGWSGGVL